MTTNLCPNFFFTNLIPIFPPITCTLPSFHFLSFIYFFSFFLLSPSLSLSYPHNISLSVDATPLSGHGSDHMPPLTSYSLSFFCFLFLHCFCYFSLQLPDLATGDANTTSPHLPVLQSSLSSLPSCNVSFCLQS